MKFIVSSSELLSHLNAIGKVINSKNTLPILDNYLFQFEEDNRLVITASDLETTLITTLELDTVEGSGAIAMPARLLNDMLREFPDQPLAFKVNMENFSVELFSESGKFNIVGKDGEEFPQVPTISDDSEEIRIEPELLLNGISRSLFATADDELRPVMNGIFVDFGTDYLTFAASDSQKLMRYRRTDVRVETPCSFILPKKPANLLKNLLPKEDEAVRVSFDAKNAMFRLGKHTMVCRLLEGKYPAYDTIIPKESPNVLLVDRQGLCNIVRRVSVFASESSNLIKMSIEGGQLVISAQDVEYTRSAVERIACQYDGEEMQIGFKSTFMLEILSNIDSSDVRIELLDYTRAGLFMPAEKAMEEEDVLMLLMPLMLNV